MVGLVSHRRLISAGKDKTRRIGSSPAALAGRSRRPRRTSDQRSRRLTSSADSLCGVRRMPKLARCQSSSTTPTEDRASGAMRSVQTADVTLAGKRELREAVDARAPGAPGTHLLALHHACDAGIGAGGLQRVRALGGAAGASPEAADLRCARIRDGRRARSGALANQARAARGAAADTAVIGHLQIDVRRLPDSGRTSCARLHVEVEVANFHPAIALETSAGASTTPPRRASTCS